jgi:hypothetical protein
VQRHSGGRARGGRGRSLALLALAVLALFAVVGTSYAQRGRGRGRPDFSAALGDPNGYYTPPEFRGNVPYDGRFTFARIKYRGFAHFTNEGPGWSHDYPRSESHLMRIMRDITSIRPFLQDGPRIGGVIVALDEPALFRYPVGYLSEPGGWFPNEKEVTGFRNYLLKGGFIIVDDFGGMSDWANFTQQVARALPKAQLVQLTGKEPIFDSFFKIDLNVIRQTYRGTPVYFGIYQDNDPRKRMILIANFNNDIGEYWEFSDQGFAPVPQSNEAYKLGVNYLVYALTH